MKWIKYIFIVLLMIIGITYISIRSMILSPPNVDYSLLNNYGVQQQDSNLWVCDDNWLHKNKGGIYELYISGAPFEMGLKNGLLTKELAQEQELHFVNFIKTLIPSETTLNYLRYFITIFNKDLDDFIPLEYRKEIYGISLSASDDFDFIGDKYHRMLNYHAAHDIGHTIQNMNLVNCTAFSVQNEYTNDSSLYVGRNLDFSAGDDFARKKIVVFCKPDSGYKFAYIAWGGMIGVLSGMNEHGLSISLNSAKSGIPMSAKSPVSLVSRAVLQNAKNIKEAYEIIANHETFVSESFFVSSAFDNKAVVIEKSLDHTDIFDSEQSKLVLTNHFQSKKLADSKLNIEAKNEGCSVYRLNRTHELIDQSNTIDHEKVVAILRDKKGLNKSDIGLGNEMAVNQLICHHSVVFKPSERLMWVSQFPYQENDFIAYDLNILFSDTFDISKHDFTIDSLNVKSTNFYRKGGVESLWKYRQQLDSIKTNMASDNIVELSDSRINDILIKNPNYYYAYYIIAQHYKELKAFDKARQYFNKALEYEFPRKVDRQQVIDALKEIDELD